ncbi:MAG: DUF2784 domain-containing protein [Nitrospirota bacterium]|nr:MAG: DUF2784 domain-containing protein [Nitrospirota bacterium]
MIWRALADLVLLIHLAFIVFVIVGGFFASRWRWLPWIHLPAVAWAVVLEFSGWICPLTPLENSLRQASGEAGYAGGFLEHYLVQVVYPEALTPEIQIYIGLGVLLINGMAYSIWWKDRTRSH